MVLSGINGGVEDGGAAGVRVGVKDEGHHKSICSRPDINSNI